jgi:uncharacterized MAPEG superfamily protein
MTLIAACVLPYVPYVAVMIAKRMSAEGNDNHNPRDQAKTLEGWAKRAYAAHQNTFEVLPPFLLVGLICTIVHADPTWTFRIALAWIVVRLLYPLAYVMDASLVRSVLFESGNALVITNVVLAAMAPKG